MVEIHVFSFGAEATRFYGDRGVNLQKERLSNGCLSKWEEFSFDSSA